MKNQALFTLIILLGVSSFPMQAYTTQENRKKTITGKSSWTICKGVAKILVGVPLAFGGLKGFLGSLTFLAVGSMRNPASNDEKGQSDLAAYGTTGAVISAGCVAGGGYLAYNGIQDLNDNEEEKSEVEYTQT